MNEETKSESIAHTRCTCDTGQVKTAMTIVMISLETMKVLRTGSLDEANGAANPVMKSGLMRRTRSGASWIMTMTVIVRTNH